MNITISFGGWEDQRSYSAPDGSGQIWRKGFSISWARSLTPHILFSLRVRMRLGGVDVEQDFTIRELAE